MLTCLPTASPVIHAAALDLHVHTRQTVRADAAVFSGAEALRLGTRERLKEVESCGFWRALLHPDLNQASYAALLQQLASIWPPLSRALRERAVALHCADWLPAPGTARLQADLACLRRLGEVPPSLPPRRVELPRGDSHHLLGMAALVSELQAHGQRVAKHVDARLQLNGEGRSFFAPPDGAADGFQSPIWVHRLDTHLRSRAACESAIRGACELLDILHQHLRASWVMAG